MNPFNIPDKIYIYTFAQDMRAGIQRLAEIVVSELDCDPCDGALYCFVSKDLKKMKMLTYDTSGWCMYYCRLNQGCFRYKCRKDRHLKYLTLDHTKLSLLLEGLDPFTIKLPKPSTDHIIL